MRWGRVGSAGGWRGDDEAAFAPCLGEDVPVGGACEFRVLADSSAVDAVEEVDPAGWCPFAVSVHDPVEEVECLVVVGVFLEESQCPGVDCAAFEFDHFEVSADCAGENTDAVGVGGEPLDEFVDGGVPLLVFLPRGEAGCLGAVGADWQGDDSGGLPAYGVFEELGAHGPASVAVRGWCSGWRPSRRCSPEVSLLEPPPAGF